ncbi:MAG: hypothetical protein CME70_08450 [Halobacteriovorax sp.]|nr:hypothetical protein [Halobacteriovorax sp.]|tara:strand:- start:157633 stop:158970 length:1338 start_codon:yes stop_codon:yes gene_type:complete
MGHKILVADDSLTVQKVVSITLASYDYDLVECKDESQLNENLVIGGASLLLLDLNLSEGKSGYEVAKSVREKSPNLPIILLLGTFDTVDEKAFSEAGINDRIVKPFESSLFTQKVQTIIESGPSLDDSSNSIFAGETESNFLNSEVEDITPEAELNIDNGDGWVVDSPAPEDKSSDTWDSFSQESSSKGENALEASLEGWGMNVPGQIGSESSDNDMELPGVIGKTEAEVTVSEAVEELDIVHEEEKNLPVESDLDYPDVGEPEVKEQSIFSEVDHQPTSALASTEEFNLDVEDNSGPSIESEIEIEEDAEDFWAADDDSSSEQVDIAMEVESEEDDLEDYHAEPDVEQIQEITIDESVSLDSLGDPRGNEPFEIRTDLSVENTTSQVNTAEIVEKILEELKPTLNELVEKHCKETIESVAWQIIPDLAENLIRNEIKEIKSSTT